MTNEKVNQILRQALSPEIPDRILNQNLKRMMEEKDMDKSRDKKRERHFGIKKAVVLAIVCCFLIGTVGIASSGVVTLVSGTHNRNFNSYQQLKEAEADAGFTIKAVESFQNGYVFSSMDVIGVKGLDEEGNALEIYKEIRITYEKQGEDNLSLYAQETAYAHDENRRTADKTVSINGIEVKYYADTYKWVPAGYELTEQDQENSKRDDYFISEGADEISENQIACVAWNQDGIRYSILNVHDATSPEILFDMAEELIMQ